MSGDSILESVQPHIVSGEVSRQHMSSTARLKKLYTEKVRGLYYCTYRHRNSECPHKHRGFQSSHDCLRHLNGILSHHDTAEDDVDDDDVDDGGDNTDDDDSIVGGSNRSEHSPSTVLRIPLSTTPTMPSADVVPALVPAISLKSTPRSAPITPDAVPHQRTYPRDIIERIDSLRQHAAPAVVVESRQHSPTNQLSAQRHLSTPVTAAVAMDVEHGAPKVARAVSADAVVATAIANSVDVVKAETTRPSDSLLSLAQLALEKTGANTVAQATTSGYPMKANPANSFMYTDDGIPDDFDPIADTIGTTYIPPSMRKWRCPVCNRTYGTRSHLGRHRRTHLPLRQYTCRFATAGYPCSKPQFNDVSNLKKHMEEVHCGWARPTPREDRISDVELFGICINTKVKRIAMPPLRTPNGPRLTAVPVTSLLACDASEYPAVLQPQTPREDVQRMEVAAQ